MRRLALLAALAASGCAQPHQIRDRSDYLAEATRAYQGETRERVIRAAEIVLRQSDPADFEFRHHQAGFEGRRRYFIYAVVASASGHEKWDFTTEQIGPNAIRASVSIADIGTAASSSSHQNYDAALANVELYRLFWKRVDYVLGRGEWVSCTDADEALQKRNENATAALSGLCGITSDGRAADAPPQLPRVAVAAADPAKRR